MPSVINGLEQENLNQSTWFRGRRQIRSQKNALDKCTIVSILPKMIDEVKFTIEPGRFHIEPGSPETPALLVVGPSVWWKDHDPEMPMLEIVHGSIQVAESVIRDYCNGMLACDMDTAIPGLFYIEGEHSLATIRMKFKGELERANTRQNKWYGNLVAIGDALWARSNGNPLAISDEMRLAARSLRLDDKPWLRDFKLIQQVPCHACGSLKDPKFPVCAVCKAIDLEYKGEAIKFAV